MTDLELHDWALLRYGSEDLANKLAIVGQMRTDDETDEKKVVFGRLQGLADSPAPPQ